VVGAYAHNSRVALMSSRPAGTNVVWRVSVAEIGTGKVVGTADIGNELLQDVAISGHTVVVLDKDNRKVFRFAIPDS
jgi:molecular chaperone HscA